MFLVTFCRFQLFNEKIKKAYEHEDRYYNLFNRLSGISNFTFFIPLTPLDDRMT